jgi:hypothetical protein
MKRTTITLALLLLAVVTAGALALRSTPVSAGGSPSANGHGTLVMPDGSKRQFSFSATTKPDGTVNGSAVIHNPGFDFRSHIDVQCLLVTGNRASIGGTVKSTNDPFFDGQRGFFTVFDNGEPGKGNDTISLVFFDAVVGPEACQQVGPDDFEQLPIDAGNIQVKP